ncbi:acetolactate synthase large subunit [Corynebacterium sp. 320]|uniref:Acetolactate synthase n=1 Tax=Corynebacterium zhongnanshanii TaxID=2768834 RepID=A0ABQ6VG60_9CORY|nr:MULTISPECIES: acetolactate synthase large subunit [Corynebacterium]KAB1503900.1 acetolactate synthase large subunit [Corynebacterium sp. 320]KAB1553001.1 acetolactate synthase large subunit [Corynebacterium sp. 321]KAB1553779.1 acetolactate synthase large subunit [Corynebacterium sp. 319]KAB3523250.1 acetolactate synthase large subunit [Corynebacterium zhongnanshanii]KAB3528036.1 acetolactate synthase large subunit [Corynebacterium sp. 250]
MTDASRSQPSPATVAKNNRSGSPERINGAQAIVRSLEELGTDVVFGLPGGAVLPLYEALYSSEKLNHILVRHEQGAGHAATGYAQVTGRVGVCIATSGPGATNLVTPIADANMDSVPLVAITGQVGRQLLGTDAFQEADIRGVTMPITKHNFMVTRPEDIPGAIAEAFHVASTGRPGAVLVDIPKDIQNAELDFVWPPVYDLPGYRPVTTPHSRQIEEAAKLISAAERPTLYIGGGVIKSDATDELIRFAEANDIPVVTTLMALGAFPYSHELNMGMPGMHGTVPAVAAMQKSDLLITIGARFDDRVTGQLESFAPDAQVIHADIDPAEIGKIREAQVPIVGDAREVLTALHEAMEDLDLPKPETAEWLRYLNKLKTDFPRGYEENPNGKLAPQFVINTLSKVAGPDAIYVAGVGQHQMWAAQFVDYEKPRTWLNSGGLGTMGYSVPAAMGAQAGDPDATVWAIDGDGCFQMTNQELVTCAVENLPIKVALINNGNLGMVRQWQTLFFDGHYSNTNLKPKEEYLPDFLMLAESMGCAAFRVTKEEEVEPTIRKAMEINDRPVVIDFIVGEDAQVWPMVPAGTSNQAIQYARDLRPLFDDEESAAEDPAEIHEVVEEGEQN